MTNDVYGDWKVGRLITAGRRVETGFTSEDLTATREIGRYDFQWLMLSAAADQDAVLPDATTLEDGWDVVIYVPEDSVGSIDVNTFHAVTPVSLRDIIPGRAYRFTLVDNTSSAGEWFVDLLEEADKLPAERHIKNFNATTDWGSAAGGYYTISVTAATHGRGVNPVVKLEVISGADHIIVSADRLLIESNGNVKIRVPDTPNLRFAGRAVFL